jgi:hypothetical protein
MTDPNTNRSAERERIISRIRKLASMTVERGASENEAAQAALLMSKLLEEFSVQSSELELRSDARGCIKDSIIAFHADRKPWMEALWAVAELYSCKAWRTYTTEDILGIGLTEDVTHLNFYGFPEDVAACLALGAIIQIARNGGMAEFIKTKDARRKGSRVRNIALDSFDLGFAERITERIREIIAAKPKAITGNALIVLKDQLVTEEWANYSKNMRWGRARAGYTIGDSAAYARGSAHASGVALHGKPLTASALRIGRS